MTKLKEENAQCGDIAENNEISNLKIEKNELLKNQWKVIILSQFQITD